MAALEMFDNAQNFWQMLNELKKNPIAFAAERKFKIPEGMTDPNEITNYLAYTGQISQNKINNVMAMKNNPLLQRMFGGK